MSTDKLHFKTALKRYPHTEKLIDGIITDPLVQLDCQEIEPIYKAFAPMARNQIYDVSEMAIVTYLQARAYNKPVILLPTVVAARLQQKCIVFNAKRHPMGLADLTGAKVGVRAYTQTTGMWVRAILAGTYGIPTESIKWITFEEGHLAEYIDPAFCTRMPKGSDMLGMLKSGELDAAIFGNDLPSDDGIVSLIPNSAQADQIWYEKNGFVPVNHTVVMNRAVAEKNPESVKAVYRMFKQGKASASPVKPGQKPNELPDGIDALRHPLEMILGYCEEQKLLPRKLTVDEIFADCLEFLGDEAH
jgi:4,5-dihydroxyphthalate decarboxylase